MEHKNESMTVNYKSLSYQTAAIEDQLEKLTKQKDDIQN
jgi:hypothetical protein